jgi:hypothetical protein
LAPPPRFTATTPGRWSRASESRRSLSLILGRSR